MTAPSSPRLRRALAAAGLLAAAAVCPGLARAEDGEGGDETAALEAQIKEQMEKILGLMRDNAKAILEASLGGGKRPTGVEVTPPPVPEGPGGAGMDAGMEGATPPPAGMDEPPPAGRGDDIRAKMEELIRGARERGGSIPGELEELVRMIPTQGGGSGGGGSDSQDSSPRHDLPNPDDPNGKKPESARKDEPRDGDKQKDKPDGGHEPPKAETADPADAGIPTWMTNLPDEVRRAIVAGKIDDVPAAYRPLFQRWRKWLAEKARERGR